MFFNFGEIKRGDIFLADLGLYRGREQQGIRPVVVIQNNIGNKYSPTVIVAAITSQVNKKILPVHVKIEPFDLEKNSVILLEQIRTLDKKYLKERRGQLRNSDIMRLNEALRISVGL